jgi:glycosyl transferase family 25
MNEIVAHLKADWPVFVVNLDRSVERMRLFEQEASRAGLSFVRHSATDGRSIDRTDARLVDAATIAKACDGGLSNGELGCYLSHVEVWQTALTQTRPWVLVLEDDARIDQRLSTVLANVDRLPEDWEIVILQRESARRQFARQRFLPGVDLLRHLHIGYYATGYLIHRRALERLAPHLLPVRWPIDHWDRWWAEDGLVVYRTDADLVTQDPTLESTVQRNSTGALVASAQPLRLVLSRRLWRNKMKLLRLLRLSHAMLATIGRRVRPQSKDLV